MKIWAIADLHLSFGVTGKEMSLFGAAWKDHAQQIETHWRNVVTPEDLVLIPGDISWGLKLSEALPDLQWIERLPGTKLLLKGNHDYWWGSLKQVTAILPPSLHLIQNNAFFWKGAAIGGARLWDTPEYSFSQWIEVQKNPKEKIKEEAIQEDLGEALFERELIRLRTSLSLLDPKAQIRIAMTHYPPIGKDLQPSRASKILEEFGIQVCVFGHLHSLKPDFSFCGEARGVRYCLTSSDYLHFQLMNLGISLTI